MAHASDPELLTLHAVRLLGYAAPVRVAGRYGQPRGEIEERLLDLAAAGLVQRSEFGGDVGWSLTARGKADDERRLAAELDRSGARDAVLELHRRFGPLNADFLRAVTRWQLHPHAGDALAANDHSDPRWDDRTLTELAAVGRRLRPLTADVASRLERFGGYADRYDAALDRALAGETRWVDGIGLDSLHVVWMQLHEDLLATLGISREAEVSRGDSE